MVLAWRSDQAGFRDGIDPPVRITGRTHAIIESRIDFVLQQFPFPAFLI